MPDGRPASHVRVVLRPRAVPESALLRDLTGDRRGGRRTQQLAAAAVVAGFVVAVASRASAGVTLAGTGLVTVVLVAAVASVSRRASGVPGPAVANGWSSAAGAYLGPFDGPDALAGAADFARQYRAEARVPAIHLTVAPSGLAIVPATSRSADGLRVPWPAITELELVRRDRRTRAVGLLTKDGRRASLAVDPDDRLVDLLTELGAQVTAL